MIISYKKLFFWHVLPWLLGWSAVLYYMLVMQQPFNWRTLLCFMLGWWLATFIKYNQKLSTVQDSDQINLLD